MNGAGAAGAGRGAAGAVWWLTAQTLTFGLTAALVGVVANAMFLDAYGSRWLPVTYIVIGAAGVAVSAGIAGASRRYDLVPIATTVLGSITVVFGAAWVLARDGDGAWVSGPLLVVFAVLIELGFVFVGMQAGRVLDIAGIKARMPRIMAGFPIGAIAGGLLGGPLVTWLGRTEGLLLPTTLAQAAFTALVWLTGRRYAPLIARPPSREPRPVAAEGRRHGGLSALLANRFVVLILVYQVLSALGSQLSDYLVMDRAAARYPGSEDLARFVAGYTAVMNTVIILFLAVLAGPLMRRYGLRLGIAANPLVVTVLALGMVVVLVVSGGTSLGLLVTVSAARIADLALSDGTTRTSVNAMYQVLPPASRVEAQATVEGMGVPLAIGVSGVVILLVNLLPSPLPVTIAATVLVCAAWSWAAFALYREYRPALVAALHRHPVLDEASGIAASAEDVAAARRLVARGDAAAVRLALEIVGGMDRPTSLPELESLARDPDLEVRLTALAGLAAGGDPVARTRLARQVGEAATSAAPGVRRRVALVVGALDAAERAALLPALLTDPDLEVRRAALTSVTAADAEVALGPVLEALRDPRTAAAAAAAVRALGDAAVPGLASALGGAGTAGDPWVRRLAGAVAPSPARDAVLLEHVDHEDHAVGLAALHALGASEPSTHPGVVAAADAVIRSEAGRAARLLVLDEALGDVGEGRPDDRALRRALADELDLLRARVGAALAAGHGTAALAGALSVLRSGDGELGVAVEAVEVVVGAQTARLALPLLDPRPSAEERLERLEHAGVAAGDRPLSREEALLWLVEAGGPAAPSPWLRACAVAAAGRAGLLGQCDLTAARAARDAVLVEQLAAVP